jgi:outer membrane receptor protein involved in Fe transport
MITLEMRTPRSLLALLFVLALSVSIPATGQVTGGTLIGTVSDTSGAVVPKAEVTIVAVDTGVTRVVSTDSKGVYSAPNLSSGKYTITTSAAGFKTEVQTGITLTVGSEQELNITLRVGSRTEEVRVAGLASGVELATSNLSGAVDAQTVRDLPLNGRDWTQLATLQPGVNSLSSIQPSTGGSASGARGNRGFGTQLTISGSRPQQNSYRIDGINVNDWLNGGPGSVLGATLGVDAVEEFSVLTSSYSAEYGRTSGGVVNAINHSGTNQFHGAAYEFVRNSALDAKNFFDQQMPPFKRNQFGASVGGPIVKKRTFFFADYEGLRQSLGITNVDVVPSQDARNGNLHLDDGTPYSVVVDPLVIPYLPLWPLPNAGLLGNGDFGTYKLVAQAVTSENFATVRIDQTISSKDSIFGSYQFDNGLTTLPDALANIQVGQKRGRQFLAIEESHVFSPQLLNSFRIGVNRVTANGGYANAAINPLAADETLAAVPGFTAPQINVSGFNSFQGGLKNYGFTTAGFTSYQAYDDAFLTTGKHALKFGFAFERMATSVIQDNTDGGQYGFGSLPDFLTNNPNTLSAGLLAAHSPRDYRQNILGFYLQDDIHWRPTFTLNLGLRYEMSSVPTETHGKLSNLRTLTSSAYHLGNPYFQNPTLRNFEPRIGFSWDPFRDGKTAVRGGFGMFDVLPLVYEYGLTGFSAAPFTLQGRAVNLPQGSFPTGAFELLQGQSLLRVGYVEFKPHRNYVMQWNLNVQRQLASDLTATIAYVGSRGVHMVFRADDENMVLPTLTPAGYLWPSPAGSGTVLNPTFGRMDYTDWESNAFYDALQVQVLKRMSHGFQVQGSYTWSKSIDEGSMGGVGDPFNSSISNLFFFDRKLSRGLSDFNVPQQLTINYLWNRPRAKSLQGVSAWALGGWELGGIFQVQRGVPFTPLMGGDPLGTNDNSPYAFPNRLSGPGCQSAVNPGNVQAYIKVDCFAPPSPLTLLGNAGRNSLQGPGLINFDFSAFKNNYIRRVSENFNVQFRADLFNIFNHPNFLPPLDNMTVLDQSGGAVSGAGLIDGTATTSRQIQFGVKVIW